MKDKLKSIANQLRLLYKRPESLTETPIARNMLWNMASELDSLIPVSDAQILHLVIWKHGQHWTYINETDARKCMLEGDKLYIIDLSGLKEIT